MNERGEQWARREEEEYKDKRGNNWVEGVNDYLALDFPQGERENINIMMNDHWWLMEWPFS
jgi:hypothetical protein